MLRSGALAMNPDQAGRRKVALVVLGMHRSGTSAMTRALSLAGAKLPAMPLPPGPDNVDGHWEPLEVVTLNEKILSALDSSWSDTFGPRGFRTKPLQVDQYLDEACEILRRNYDGKTCIVVKEPRMTIFVDLWAAALKREGFQPGFVIMVRHPLEVAESLKVRNGFIREKSLVLWTTYMLAAELGTRREKRVFVRYDDLMADPEATLDAIESGLMVQLPRRSWAATLEIQEYLKSDHRHHIAGDRKINSKSLVGIEKLYEYFEAAGKGQPLNADVADEAGAWLSNVEETAGILIKDEERQRRAAAEEAESWAKRADEANRQLDAVKAELADIIRDRDNRETVFQATLAESRSDTVTLQHDWEARLAQVEEAYAAERETALAELEDAHRARVAELEETMRESERARADDLRVAISECEAAHRAQLAALEETLRAEREAALAEREDAHRARVAELEEMLHASERARVAELEAALRTAENARMSEREAEAMLRIEQEKAQAKRDEAHREQLAQLGHTLSASEGARAEAVERIEEAHRRAAAAETRANDLSAAFAASENELEIQGGQLRDALYKAEAEFKVLSGELTEMRQTVGHVEAHNIALTSEARASRDRSSELARELTSVIADRSRILRYSALELQMAALRRLWPFR